MGEGGGGEEKGGKEFLSFTSLPFSLPFFPFSPETPDTQAMITGSRQKLSRCEESALSLCLDGRQLEQTQEERLLGLDIDATLMIPRFL